MKLASIFAVGFFLLVSVSVAVAQTDCTKIVPPSPWGPNDQTGATNRVTAAVTKAAAAEIQEGKVIPLTWRGIAGSSGAATTMTRPTPPATT